MSVETKLKLCRLRVLDCVFNSCGSVVGPVGYGKTVVEKSFDLQNKARCRSAKIKSQSMAYCSLGVYLKKIDRGLDLFFGSEIFDFLFYLGGGGVGKDPLIFWV